LPILTVNKTQDTRLKTQDLRQEKEGHIRKQKARCNYEARSLPFDYPFGPFDYAPPFAILLRQGYEGTS